MKITLSRDEVAAILMRRAQQIGEDCCADDQKVLAVKLPHLTYNEVLVIEIGWDGDELESNGLSEPEPEPEPYRGKHP